MRGRIKVRLRRKHNCTRFSGNGAVSNHGNVREGEPTPLLGKSLAGNLQFAESFYLLVAKFGEYFCNTQSKAYNLTAAGIEINELRQGQKLRRGLLGGAGGILKVRGSD